jgi:copper(I)-binding protein
VKTIALAPIALAFATLALAACGSQQQPSSKQASAPAKPVPAQGISVSDGRLVLPAVHGNPGAVYFTVHNDSDTLQTLERVELEGAQGAMLHDTGMVGGHMEMRQAARMDVPSRGELVFSPGGRHVMAMHLDDRLKPGGTTTLTLAFTSGQKATLPVEILAAGNAR